MPGSETYFLFCLCGSTLPMTHKHRPSSPSPHSSTILFILFAHSISHISHQCFLPAETALQPPKAVWLEEAFVLYLGRDHMFTQGSGEGTTPVVMFGLRVSRRAVCCRRNCPWTEMRGLCLFVFTCFGVGGWRGIFCSLKWSIAVQQCGWNCMSCQGILAWGCYWRSSPYQKWKTSNLEVLFNPFTKVVDVSINSITRLESHMEFITTNY